MGEQTYTGSYYATNGCGGGVVVRLVDCRGLRCLGDVESDGTVVCWPWWCCVVLRADGDWHCMGTPAPARGSSVRLARAARVRRTGQFPT